MKMVAPLLFVVIFMIMKFINSFNNEDDCTAIGDYNAGGFKNMVFNSISSGSGGIEDLNNYIIRVGFVHSGSKVLNFRSDDKSIEEYKVAVRIWNAQLSNECQYSSILSKMVEFEDHVKARDIVPRRDLDKEYHFQAQSSAVSKCFGSSSPIRRKLLPLPPSKISNHSISLVLEYYVRLSGNMRSIVGQMKEHELISLFYCYLIDQLSLRSQLGKFHVDGHAGNLLYTTRLNGKHSFVWSDFGKTSESSLMGSQFLNSLASVHNCILEAAVPLKYDRLVQLLVNIANYSSNYDPPFIMSEFLMQSLRDNMTHDILKLFNTTEVGTILTDMAPFSSFGIAHIQSQVVELTKSRAEQMNINAEQAMINIELKKSYIELNRSYTELNRSYTELKKSHAELKKSNAELTITVGEIWAQLRGNKLELDRKNAELESKNAELDTKNAEIAELLRRQKQSFSPDL